MDSRTYTYQARLVLNESQERLLERYAVLYGKIERALFAAFSRNESIIKLKASYLRRFHITARQFNAIRVGLEGKIASLSALQNDYVLDAQERVKQTKKTIRYLDKLKHKTPKQALSFHQKTRKLASLEQKLTRLKADKESGRVRLCFGSKRLFKKQHHLKENGYESMEAWRTDWQASRSNQFYVLGSKDETMGNQSCVASIEADGSLKVRLRMPDALDSGKTIEISNIRFDYGQQAILEALNENLKRTVLSKKSEKKKHGDLYKQHGQAINYRFVKDSKGWRVFITIQRVIKPKTLPHDGAIGVDINVDHLAVAEINRTGNLVHAFSIPLNTYGKSHEQAQALIGDAIKQVVAFAEEKQKPIVIESLDFAKKKRDLKSTHPHYARMLSSFSYSSIIEMLKSRAFRYEVAVFQVNPAYSSVIGRVKFARIYSHISVHQAAAMVIARRFFRFSERLPRYWAPIPDSKGGHVTLQGLVKILSGHVWRSWANVQKCLKEAHAAPYQKIRQGAGPPELTWDKELTELGF